MDNSLYGCCLPENKERNHEIMRLRLEELLDLGEISQKIGLTKERIRQIISKHMPDGGSGQSIVHEKYIEKRICANKVCGKEFEANKRDKLKKYCSSECGRAGRRRFPWINGQPTCNDCGSTENVYKNNRCRKCNTERCRVWRNLPGKMDIVYKNNLKSNKKYPEKFLARQKLNYHLKSGNLVKPSHCIQCPEAKIYAHHPDYSKPLEVLWLCSVHHFEEHKKNETA